MNTKTNNEIETTIDYPTQHWIHDSDLEFKYRLRQYRELHQQWTERQLNRPADWGAIATLIGLVLAVAAPIIGWALADLLTPGDKAMATYDILAIFSTGTVLTLIGWPAHISYERQDPEPKL